MRLTEIIKEVEKLSPADKAKVADALRHSEVSANATTIQEKQDVLNQRLLAEGLLKRIPPRSATNSKFKPVKIKGKLLSETIVEDRR